MSSSYDVAIVGAGPAGSLAALCLARRGARVVLVDRARFPRDKLCGDTLNPGALRILGRHGLAGAVEAAGLAIDGMLVTSGTGVTVRGSYGGGRIGRALTRRVLDALMLDAAVREGVEFRDGVRAEAPVVDEQGGCVQVRGVRTACAHSGRDEIRATVTIAADGRRSPIAVALGLARQPLAPRRWAIGAHFEGIENLSSLGEMHLRDSHYLGIAPLDAGLANVCLVSPAGPGFDQPARLLERRLAEDVLLSERVTAARRVGKLRTLGPLALDVRAAGVPGLLLAGDAAGFIDPMTGDGLRFALRGAELAADVAADCVARPDVAAHVALARLRARELGGKMRVNRVLRHVTASPMAMAAAARAARMAPQVLRALIRYAGDVRTV